MSAVSTHEDEQEGQEDKREDVMEEELRRVFGESSKEVVEREIGEEAVRARARKTETVPSQRGVRAQPGSRSFPELVPELCQR